MQEYVLGFAYNTDLEEVLLINKTKPDWQAGRLNGVGGKVESGESPLEAMKREFLEEVGVDTKTSDWKHFCRLTVGKTAARVWCFSTFTDAALWAEQMEIEVPQWIDYEALPPRCLPNLRWLVPMGMEKDLVLAHVEERITW